MCLIADTISKDNRRKIAGWTIMFTCVGVLLLTYSASDLGLPGWVDFSTRFSCSENDLFWLRDFNHSFFSGKNKF